MKKKKRAQPVARANTGVHLFLSFLATFAAGVVATTAAR